MHLPACTHRHVNEHVRQKYVHSNTEKYLTPFELCSEYSEFAFLVNYVYARSSPPGYVFIFKTHLFVQGSSRVSGDQSEASRYSPAIEVYE